MGAMRELVPLFMRQVSAPPYEPMTFGGMRMSMLFSLYDRNPGWWNNNQQWNMTKESFVGLMISWEMQFNYSHLPLFEEAVAREIWTGDGENLPFCDKSCSYTDIMNFLAANVESAQRRARLTSCDGCSRSADTMVLPTYDQSPYYNTFKNNNAAYISMSIIGDRVVNNPKPAWKVLDKSAPYTWGNRSYGWNDDWREIFLGLPKGVILGPNSLAWLAIGSAGDRDTGKAFVVVSINQRNCLQKNPGDASCAWVVP